MLLFKQADFGQPDGLFEFFDFLNSLAISSKPKSPACAGLFGFQKRRSTARLRLSPGAAP